MRAGRSPLSGFPVSCVSGSGGTVSRSVHIEDVSGLKLLKNSKQMSHVSGALVGGMDTVLKHSLEA